MTVYTVRNEEELEEKLQDGTVHADNIIQFRKGSELKRYKIQPDGSYLPINSENNMRNTYSAQNTRKHSNPHIKESLANLSRLHKSKRNTKIAMQSLGTLSITPKHTIKKRRTQKSTKQVKGFINYSGYPNFVRRRLTGKIKRSTKK